MRGVLACCQRPGCLKCETLEQASQGLHKIAQEGSAPAAAARGGASADDHGNVARQADEVSLQCRCRPFSHWMVWETNSRHSSGKHLLEHSRVYVHDAQGAGVGKPKLHLGHGRAGGLDRGEQAATAARGDSALQGNTKRSQNGVSAALSRLPQAHCGGAVTVQSCIAECAWRQRASGDMIRILTKSRL